MNTILWQRIEGALVFVAAMGLVIALSIGGTGYSWWVLVLLFFAPDIGFLGYLAGPKVGAAVYNVLHLYGIWLGIALLGSLGFGPHYTLLVFGLLWLGHVGFDRMFGYGLKEPTGFGDTHLGRIGKG